MRAAAGFSALILRASRHDLRRICHGPCTRIGATIRQLYYPPNLSDAPPPFLCRLYFGKQVRHSKFVNPVNFPLDVARYTALCARPDIRAQLLPIEEVVGGMGEMLARVHWIAGYDARDIEFVMGGTGYGAVRYYVFDFNQVHACLFCPLSHLTTSQMCRFDVMDDPIAVLVDSFFVNDPYYPRPRSTDVLYVAFKAAYIAVCPEELRARGEGFFAALEVVQAKRDALPS